MELARKWQTTYSLAYCSKAPVKGVSHKSDKCSNDWQQFFKLFSGNYSLCFRDLARNFVTIFMDVNFKLATISDMSPLLSGILSLFHHYFQEAAPYFPSRSNAPRSCSHYGHQGFSMILRHQPHLKAESDWIRSSRSRLDPHLQRLPILDLILGVGEVNPY